ncbi:MAG TPA: head-tail connector protein [Bosea sp. (in: a-proteobacteria)]|jgi:hypothetical protein|uniref:head-tail connector protein n=1 Tax=Bosea sp. (in: a-proteobacteria) TaxID=1871050 RepID=UPI002E0D3B45|nr:head-tail connector protein [Bosea sp. (in: a-proteobacteria)]
MAALSLSDAKAHLRVSFSDDDVYIQSLIDAAEAYVGKIGVALATPVPAPVLHAVKLLLSHWYQSRDAAGEKPSQSIAFGVDALLQPYREQSL